MTRPVQSYLPIDFGLAESVTKLVPVTPLFKNNWIHNGKELLEDVQCYTMINGIILPD